MTVREILKMVKLDKFNYIVIMDHINNQVAIITPKEINSIEKYYDIELDNCLIYNDEYTNEKHLQMYLNKIIF